VPGISFFGHYERDVVTIVRQADGVQIFRSDLKVRRDGCKNRPREG